MITESKELPIILDNTINTIIERIDKDFSYLDFIPEQNIEDFIDYLIKVKKSLKDVNGLDTIEVKEKMNMLISFLQNFNNNKDMNEFITIGVIKNEFKTLLERIN